MLQRNFGVPDLRYLGGGVASSVGLTNSRNGWSIANRVAFGAGTSYPVGYRQSALKKSVSEDGQMSSTNRTFGVATTANPGGILGLGVLSATTSGIATTTASIVAGRIRSGVAAGIATVSTPVLQGIAYLKAVLNIGSRPSAYDIAQEVWGALASLNNVIGTMGELLNSAAAGGGGGGGGPSAATIAAAVWDRLLSLHTTPGSAGKILSDAGGGATPSTIASAVRTELTTELGRIDTNVSSRASQVSVDGKPNLAAIEGSTILAKEATVATRASQTSVNSIPTNPLLTTDVRLNNLDAAISSRLASAGYTSPPSVGAIATQVRTELATELARIDAAISSRLATAGYTSPPTVFAIADQVWDELLSGHAISGSAGEALSGAGGGATPGDIASAVRLELAVELARIDAAITTRLATAGYTVPPTASTIASQVRAELTTELGRIDAPVSTRSTPAQVNTEVTNALNTYDPPTKAELDSAIAGIPAINYTSVANAVWTATTRSLNVDVTLGASEINEIAVAIESAIINEGDGQQVIDAIVQAINNAGITAPLIGDAVRTELAAELARIDVNISSRASQGSVYGLY